MAGQPQFGAVREDFGGLQTVLSELVRSLNSAAHNAGEALTSRENKFKRDIQFLLQKFHFEKLGFEKERNELINRLKEKEVDQEELIELKKRNCELECEKLRAKTDLYVCEKRIKELEGKVLSLEKEKDASLNVIAAETNAGKRKVRENFGGNEVARETNVNLCDRSSQWGRTLNTKAFVESEALQKTNLNPSDRSSQWERTGKTKEWERAVTVQRNARESFVEREALLKANVNPSDSSSQWKRTGGKSKVDINSSKTDVDVYEKRIKELEGRLLIMNVEKDASTAETNSGKRKVSEENMNAGVGSSGKQRRILPSWMEKPVDVTCRDSVIRNHVKKIGKAVKEPEKSESEVNDDKFEDEESSVDEAPNAWLNL